MTIKGTSKSVLYGCKTWCLTLREERRLRVFKNRVLRRIFWSKKVEVAGGWRILHYEELWNLCALSNIIRVIKSRKTRCGINVAPTLEVSVVIILMLFNDNKLRDTKVEWPLMIGAILSGSLPPEHGTSSCCGWRRRLPDMEGSCECTE
jgi:hypothetical protein